MSALIPHLLCTIPGDGRCDHSLPRR